MLHTPLHGTSAIEENVGTTSAEFGATITASATPHTKGSYTALIAATAYDAYGITVLIGGTATTASVNARALMDVAIGAAASEVVLLPNLMCGNVAAQNAASCMCVMYHFPIYIAAGSRLAARLQGLIASETATCAIWLHQWPIGVTGWFGTRVTAYGANTATSSGVSHSPGSSTYATATQITASITNPIKAIQIGYDLLTDTTGDSVRCLLRLGLGSTPTYFVSDVPFHESTTVESVQFSHANFLLSHMRFDIPAGSDLRISAMRSTTATARGWVVYGVD